MNCEDKINMLVSSDEKKAKILKDETTYKEYMADVRTVLNDARISSSEKRIKSQEIYNKAQEYLSKKNLNTMQNLEKRTALALDAFDKLEKTSLDIKGVLLSDFERNLSNPTTLYSRAQVILESIDNPVKDTLISTGHLETAQAGAHDPHIMDILIKGHDNDVPAALKKTSKEIAAIFKNAGLAVYNVFNDAGAMLKFRDDHALTMRHNAAKILEGGQDKWIIFMKRTLDFKKTFQGINEANIDKLLSEGFDELTENALDLDHEGADKILKRAWSPDRALANLKTYQSKRIYHFKDGASWMDYSNTYGDAKTVLEHITERNKSTSKAIALMEKYGSEARTNFETHTQTMLKFAGKDLSRIQKDAITREANIAYDYFTGRANGTIPGKLATAGSVARDAAALAHLGKSVLASVFYDPFAIAMQRYINTGKSPLISAPIIFAKNLANLFEYHGSQSKIEFAKNVGLAIDTVQEELLHRVYGADAAPGPSRTRKMLNAMYTYSGASHANKVARITGTLAAIEDFKYVDGLKSDHKFKKLFIERTGISEAEIKTINEVYSSPQGKITDIKSTATRQKLAAFMHASYEASSPGVDARFKRMVFGGQPAGSLTGEIYRAVGQYKGASFTQMYSFGEFAKAANPNPLKTSGLGSLQHSGVPLAALAFTTISMGLAKSMLSKVLDGDADKIDLTDKAIYKNAVQSSGVFGGALSDIIVPAYSWGVGDQTFGGTADQMFSWAAPSVMYTAKGADKARKALLKTALDGKDLSRKEIEQLMNLTPYNNVPGMRAARSLLLDLSGY